MRLDPTTLQIETILAPFLLASRAAARVSAVSPDWLTAITSVSLEISGLRYLNSEEWSTHTGTRARKKRLNELQGLKQTVVFYESPHRILKTLEDMLECLGNRQIAIGREVTKKFEEIIRATPEELIKVFEARKPRGEFVLIF